MDAKIKANVTSFRVRYNLKDDNEAMSGGSIQKLQGDIAKLLLLPLRRQQTEGARSLGLERVGCVCKVRNAPYIRM